MMPRSSRIRAAEVVGVIACESPGSGSARSAEALDLGRRVDLLAADLLHELRQLLVLVALAVADLDGRIGVDAQLPHAQRAHLQLVLGEVLQRGAEVVTRAED